jgi:hypothetical protein
MRSVSENTTEHLSWGVLSDRSCATPASASGSYTASTVANSTHTAIGVSGRRFSQMVWDGMYISFAARDCPNRESPGASPR